MTQGIQLFVYPVSDIARSRALYREALGVEPYADWPYYVGFRTGGQEIGLDPNGHAKGMKGPIGYLQVSDIRSRLEALLASGAREREGVTDVGGGRLIAWVEDADGNIIGLQQMPDGAPGP
jgi:predicted enzyme related to lactoylglutathione lyase